ncbi:MAG: hypothetical protein IJT65_08540 [Eubacterium sp.]|nr:hypothetical protein [Eubacterium sp.]
MTVKELCEVCSLEAINLPDPEREVNGVYIGDLLSWVMGKAGYDNAWITIMSNVNVIAVATLTDVSCIILAEGVKLESDVLETAKQKEINVLSSPAPAYETAQRLFGKV